MTGEPRPTDRTLYTGPDDHLETWLIEFDRLLMDRGEEPANDAEVLAIYDLGYSPIGACEMVLNARRGR